MRVQPSYLSEIAAWLADPGVGLVTHLIAGVGERRAGSLLENLHFAGTIAPGIAAAKRLLGRDVVMGKSMAFRREDLAALGGFEAVKDVLAEDYVLGLMVPRGSASGSRSRRRPVQNVSREKRVARFVARCQRWSVLQRKLVGPWLYASQVILNPRVPRRHRPRPRAGPSDARGLSRSSRCQGAPRWRRRRGAPPRRVPARPAPRLAGEGPRPRRRLGRRLLPGHGGLARHPAAGACRDAARAGRRGAVRG